MARLPAIFENEELIFPCGLIFHKRGFQIFTFFWVIGVMKNAYFWRIGRLINLPEEPVLSNPKSHSSSKITLSPQKIQSTSSQSVSFSRFCSLSAISLQTFVLSVHVLDHRFLLSTSTTHTLNHVTANRRAMRHAQCDFKAFLHLTGFSECNWPPCRRSGLVFYKINDGLS